MLWKQCFSLINAIGFPPNLESSVKKLWSLRLTLLSDKVNTYNDASDEVLSSQQPSEQATKPQVKVLAKWETKYMPTLIETLALLYLSAIQLRLPVRIGDFHRYAVKEDIPYIRAIRFVPEAITKGLPADSRLALDTTSPLAPDHLRKAVHNLCLLYQHHFAMQFAPLNGPPLIFKYVKDLAMPLNVFRPTLELADMLGIKFSFPIPKGRQRASHLPEIALVCLFVVAVKLHHPFDSQPRTVVSDEDPAILALDWEVWSRAREEHRARLTRNGRLERGSEIKVTEDHVFQMTGEQMDDYLDWYERTWVDDERAEHKPHGVPDDLLKMFPTGRQDGSRPEQYSYNEDMDREEASTVTRIQETMSQLAVRETVQGEEKNNKPVGSMYKRYRTMEDLTKYARAFHEEVAEVAAIRVETLLSAVLQVENRILAWRRQQLKSKDGQADEEEGSEGEQSDVDMFDDG